MKNTAPELEIMMWRKKNPPPIKTLNKRTQVICNWCGAYDLIDGSIHLGCNEKHTPTLIWHEILHMVLFEQYSLEAGKMWDNIANDLQIFLFGMSSQEYPFIYESPPAKAKPIDDAWSKSHNAGMRKAKEKSITVGWKPEEKKRIPPRKLGEVSTQMQIYGDLKTRISQKNKTF